MSAWDGWQETAWEFFHQIEPISQRRLIERAGWTAFAIGIVLGVAIGAWLAS